MTTPLPAILGVGDVLERYGLRDPRTARKIMAAAGCIKIGGKIVVRADALDAYERRQVIVPTAPAIPGVVPRRPSRAKPAAASPEDGPGWYLQGAA